MTGQTTIDIPANMNADAPGDPTIGCSGVSNAAKLQWAGTAGETTVLSASGAAGKNILVSGDFSKNAFSVASSITGVSNNGNIADNFTFSFSGAGVMDSSQASDAPTFAQAGFYTTKSLRLTATTADASIAAGDHYEINAFIEGSDFTQIAQKTFSVPFWVRSAKTGVHCVAIRNSGSDRSYVGTYTIAAANTWQQVLITVSASPTGGTWDYTNGKGVVLSFILAAGSTYQGVAGEWLTGNILATSDQVNCLDTIGNIFALALVGCKQDTLATPWTDDEIAVIRARSRRLVRKSYSNGVAPATNSALGSFQSSNSASVTGALDVSVSFGNEMRALPSVTVYSVAGNAGFVTQNDASEVAATVTNIGMNGFRVTATNASTKYGCAFHYIANAQMT